MASAGKKAARASRQQFSCSFLLPHPFSPTSPPPCPMTPGPRNPPISPPLLPAPAFNNFPAFSAAYPSCPQPSQTLTIRTNMAAALRARLLSSIASTQTERPSCHTKCIGAADLGDLLSSSSANPSPNPVIFHSTAPPLASQALSRREPSSPPRLVRSVNTVPCGRRYIGSADSDISMSCVHHIRTDGIRVYAIQVRR